MIRSVACALLLFAFAGCGESSGSGRGQREQVESLIRTQLPASLRRNTGRAVVVKTVGCVEDGEYQYQCVATVTGTDGIGGLQTIDLPVTATCDDRSCIWRTTP